MTLTLELTPQEERRLCSLARREGLDVAEYARRMLGLETPVFLTPTREELEEMFDQLAEGGENLPILPPEAYNRENLYEARM